MPSVMDDTDSLDALDPLDLAVLKAIEHVERFSQKSAPTSQICRILWDSDKENVQSRLIRLFDQNRLLADARQQEFALTAQTANLIGARSSR